MVFIIHRHGDRTPIQLYPKDPYQDQIKFWPDGWAQLTLNGKKRMFQLGKYLSRRYENFLGKSPREVHVRSSGSDRCLESVSLLLAGLYPPKGRWKWNDNLGNNWQPFPIQTVPHEDDAMLNPESHCEKAKKILNLIYNSSEQVTNYRKSMESTIEYVQDNTGSTNMDLIRAEQIFDVLFIEKSFNYKLPAWVDENVYAKLEDISAKTFLFSSMNREIQRFRTGLLLSDILRHIEERHRSDKRLFIYSSHDTQISVLLSALKEFNNLAPPFGATVLLELHQELEDRSPFLKLFYLNVTESERPFELSLNDCKRFDAAESVQPVQAQNQSNHCTLERFHRSIKDLIPKDWQVECENFDRLDDEPVSIFVLMATIILTLIVMFSFIYFWLTANRHGSSYRLLPIN
ncbi:lysosomal acid phosphatase-like protein 3 [Sarcoptes scabiei]|uniref:Lysosomal acid phosphatase-like protein 3 n=1 Tax=Sarcoptes scabiei TaxID=52283 RepID=A0A132AHG1_SARSC|nr:lysosomal acid phosphatase-like protein 3 [Sarcoptes scabiei]